MNLFEPLAACICEAIPGLAPADLPFVPAPNLELGDVALRTFEAARKLKVAPPQLAARIAKEVSFGPEVASVATAGPYVNFRLHRGLVARRVVAGVLGEGRRFGSNGTGAGKRVLIEHTSINPNASPHLGRGRCAMFGDGLTRLLRFEDYDVEVHYYVNDMGRQIGLLVLVCEGREDLTFDQILELYVQANARAEADPAFAREGYELLARMEEGDSETRAKFRSVVDLCLKGQLAVLARLNVAYDVFDYESKYVKDARLDAVLDALREKGALFTDEEQRLVVDLSKIGHTQEEGRYFVLMRANGSSMYGYRDLAYTLDKRERGADINLMVLGEDHKLYAQQLALILGAAGHPAPEAIYYAYILLTEGKMSTRQGKVVLLSEFLDEAARRSAECVAKQCADIPAEEQSEIARKVAVAAIRFAILRVNPNKNVIFDWESSLSFSGDTGPYIQYSCARINSILRKHGQEVESAPVEDASLETDAEWALALKLASFPAVVRNAAEQRNCAPIAQFALDAARLFTAFYHACPVLGAETDALRDARLQLCVATRTALENALNLLGIEALERM